MSWTDEFIYQDNSNEAYRDYRREEQGAIEDEIEQRVLAAQDEVEDRNECGG